MQAETVQQQFQSLLRQIKTKKCSYQAKIRLVQGTLQRLSSISDNPQLISMLSTSFGQLPNLLGSRAQNRDSSLFFNKPSEQSQSQSTLYSFYSDSEVHNSAFQSQQRIMSKRVIKFQINEQIQALEDDLFQIQKVVETKRQLNEQMAKRIQRRMKQIGSRNVKTNKQDPNNMNRTVKKQSINYRDNMNLTISGASGFDFNKVNINRNTLSSNNNSPSSNSAKKQITINLDSIQNQQKKKVNSHYLNKSIGTVTSLFKNILK